jgi:hypothetical protein
MFVVNSCLEQNSLVRHLSPPCALFENDWFSEFLRPLPSLLELELWSSDIFWGAPHGHLTPPAATTSNLTDLIKDRLSPAMPIISPSTGIEGFNQRPLT